MPLTPVFALEPFPEEVRQTIFLAGPTPRTRNVKSWRPDMLSALNEAGFTGHVFIPEPRGGAWAEEYQDQVGWEEEALNRADCIIFWIPRDIEGGMPALTTNDEWGFWKDSGKVVLGAPDSAEKVRYQKHYAAKYGAPVLNTMEATAQEAVNAIGEGALRRGGEAQVPLMIWSKPEFQAWKEAQYGAGNRIDGARVSWAFRVPPPNFGDRVPSRLFLYALHVNMHIGSEDRAKDNEVVVFRPDVSSVVLYRGRKVVLVKEYRSPVRNAEGFVYELPGGSAPGSGEDAKTVAAHELEEELGFQIKAQRLTKVSERQVGSTLAAYTDTLFSCELTQEEMTRLEEQARKGVAHGLQEDSERTYTVVMTVEEVLASKVLDWAQVGKILSVIE